MHQTRAPRYRQTFSQRPARKGRENLTDSEYVGSTRIAHCPVSVTPRSELTRSYSILSKGETGISIKRSGSEVWKMYVQFTNTFVGCFANVIWLISFCNGYIDITEDVMLLQIYCGDSDKISSYSWLIKNLYHWKVLQVHLGTTVLRVSAAN